MFNSVEVDRFYSYDPDGNATASGSGTQSTDLKFASGYLLPGGLYHFGARYYNPDTARWTQQDPLDQIADLQQANRYAYAGGDPINMADLAGLSIFTKVANAVKGCVEGAVKGPEVLPKYVRIRVGARVFYKLVPQTKWVGCAEGAFKSLF